MSDAIATNKKAFRDYFLTDKWEAGIALKGAEVKSIRNGGVNFKASFARMERGEVFLYNVYIEPYDGAGHEPPEPERPRKLLLKKNEIKKIEGRLAQRNLTLVPTRIYFNNRGLVKIEIALGKGKKLYDKRETIKKRKIDRDISRAIRHRQTK
jgi:SsrA-binding protein